MARIDYSFHLNEIITRILKVALFIIPIFLISVNYECKAGGIYKIVILPFKDNTRLNLGEKIPDVLRSTVTQTGYFEAIDRDKIYEMAAEMVPADLIKVDNTKRINGGFTADQIDLIARLDLKKVQKFSNKLKADYAVRGAASHFADSLRLDAEIIDVKAGKTMGYVSVDGPPEGLSAEMVNKLSDEITMFCRNLNAYDDALSIMGMYNQGMYTFDISEKKLKELLLITNDTIGIHAVLMMLYLSEIRSVGNTMLHSGDTLEDKIIEEGERILYLLNQDYDEKALEVFLSLGLDPFDEIAKIYSRRGADDKAIKIYEDAVRVYPINVAGHYRGLGMLYLKEGLNGKAIEALTKSLDVNKGSYESHFILASIFEKMQQHNKATKHLEECIKYARNVEELKTAREKINELAHSRR